MSPDGGREALAEAALLLGDEMALDLLAELVAIAPTNTEDVALDRFEKPNYRRAADAIVRWARSFGLSTRIFDPLIEGPEPEAYRGLPRPNVIVELDRGAKETVLILAHFDVVPVPEEQRARWKSPPHTLTRRADGRLYGRGVNDDLGSGITASLLAMRHLAALDELPRNVRLLACVDEETGGEGGIEALRAHDAALPPGDPGRMLDAEVALIPDGGPHTVIGSCGVAFLEASFGGPVALSEALAYGETLVGLHELAASWKSSTTSPDWPDRGAPEPVIAGRATVTRFDVDQVPAGPSVRLLRAHAESMAGNQIPRAVTLLFGGPEEALGHLLERLRPLLPAPFLLERDGATSVTVPNGALALQVVGVAGHAGYPHRAHNPVPPTLRLLREAGTRGWIDASASGSAWFTVDLRLPPEMGLDDGLRPALDRLQTWTKGHAPTARVVAPPARCRPGYFLRSEHPMARKLERLVHGELGKGGLFGEYGGTDASSLRGLTTPSGEVLPALVFGSMDPAANIHDVDESVDPRLLAGVARTIERFVRET